MTDFTNQIQYLEPSKWQGYLLDFAYTSDFYYEVERTRSDAGWSVTFTKKPFEKTFVNPNVTYDSLYQAHWENAEAYGILENDTLIAAIEICPEEWSNRLRVTELWVDRRHRRQGIATVLMNLAKAKAAEQGRRAVILETQSCNAVAIAFYQAMGFELIGFDACCYGNRDIERREVRMEMGYFPEEPMETVR
ncbi:MAG: GNAT family N-acetyltransferase [Eubacteriales bacterium]